MIYKDPNFLILRSPLFSFNTIFNTGIDEILDNNRFVEALFLASPNLAEQTLKLNASNIFLKEEKIVLAVYRYWLRASYRCTPFGLFAGLSIGTFSAKTTAFLGDHIDYEKHLRLDTHFLSTIVQILLDDAGIKNSIQWYPNNTRYRILDKLRYIKYEIDKRERTHQLAVVLWSVYLETVLKRAEHGATLEDLILELIEKDIDRVDAEGFIQELIEERLLVSELEPKVSGVEFQDQLVTGLNAVEKSNRIVEMLNSIIDRLKCLENKAIGISTNFYSDLFDTIKAHSIDFDAGKLIQCDLYKPVEKFEIGNTVISELQKAISVLNKIDTSDPKSNLDTFKDEFFKKYELQEVPLLEALDSDVGLGYPANKQVSADIAPLLNGISFNTEKLPVFPEWKTTWMSFLFKKIEESLRNRSLEITLSDHEIDKIFGKDNTAINERLPDSAYTLCSILSPAQEEIDAGNFFIDHSFTSGPSAANLLSRFCYLNEHVKKAVQNCIEEEEDLHPGKVYAEILHIPEARIGNILIRPILRNYEIPIITRPSVDEDHSLPLDDLMISIKNNRVVLRSVRLNKEIIPRLSTAHNFSLNSVPHYHFLCDLQFQDAKGGLSWEWGSFNYFSFLPRVRYGRTILAKAKWLLSIEDFKGDNDGEDITNRLISYFDRNNIPDTVTISLGDNHLPIHIKNSYCQKILAQDLKKHGSLVLHECLFNDHNLFVKDKEGYFTNEFIIPWVREKLMSEKPNLKPAIANSSFRNPSRKAYLPGSRWHYMKLYCGVKTADKLLVQVIKPITQELVREGLIDKFFFIRFSDPDHHIRLRFSGKDDYFVKITHIFNDKLEPYLSQKLIWKIQYDTYEPEVYRYGLNNMENSETLFFYDSLACLEILSMLSGDEGDELRWQFAIKGVHSILNSFDFDLQAKKEIMSQLSISFLREFDADNSTMKKQLSNKYRAERSKIELALIDHLDHQHPYRPVWEIYDKKERAIIPCVDYIDGLLGSGKLEVDKFNLVSSYIHMFLNRLMRSKQRLQEMVIYDLLHQHYKSSIAQQKTRPNKKSITQAF